MSLDKLFCLDWHDFGGKKVFTVNRHSTDYRFGFDYTKKTACLSFVVFFLSSK